jgi:hypothetical protein
MPIGLLCIAKVERNVLQREGWNARCIARRILDAADVISSQRKLQRATRAVHNRAATCVAAGGGVFENLPLAHISVKATS